MRIFLHILLPLITPIVIYAIWAKIGARQKGKGLPSWEEGQWFWAIVAGFIFVGGSLLYITTFGDGTSVQYYSPRMENGLVVPGHFK
jgi:hypothetical protein